MLGLTSKYHTSLIYFAWLAHADICPDLEEFFWLCRFVKLEYIHKDDSIVFFSEVYKDVQWTKSNKILFFKMYSAEWVVSSIFLGFL